MRLRFLLRSKINHERFRELSCLSLHGQISEDEQAQLARHLAECSECSEARSEFESIALFDLPALKPSHLAAGVDEDRLLANVLALGNRAKQDASATAHNHLQPGIAGWKWNSGLSHL